MVFGVLVVAGVGAACDGVCCCCGGACQQGLDYWLFRKGEWWVDRCRLCDCLTPKSVVSRASVFILLHHCIQIVPVHCQDLDTGPQSSGLGHILICFLSLIVVGLLSLLPALDAAPGMERPLRAGCQVGGHEANVCVRDCGWLGRVGGVAGGCVVIGLLRWCGRCAVVAVGRAETCCLTKSFGLEDREPGWRRSPWRRLLVGPRARRSGRSARVGRWRVTSGRSFWWLCTW